jgi:ATP synthase protein I
MPSDLEDLGRKLEQASKTDTHKQDAENVSVGMKAGTELVGCIIVGAALGWGLDTWLGIKPFGLIFMLLLGVTAGFVNVWRITQNMGSNVGYSQLHQREKPAKNPADQGESE